MSMLRRLLIGHPYHFLFLVASRQRDSLAHGMGPL